MQAWSTAAGMDGTVPDAGSLAPGFAAILAARRLVGRPDVAAARRDPAAARAAQKRFNALFRPPPDVDVAVTRRPAAGEIGIVDLVDGTSDPRQGAVVYLHGGGLVFHDLDTFLPALTRLTAVAGRRMVALDYPKVPERSPAAVVAAVTTALTDIVRSELAQDGGRVPLLAGDSIGGLLVLHAALGPLAPLRPPLLLICPVLDLSDHRAFDSRRRFATGHLLDADFMAWFRDLAGAGLPAGFDPLALPAAALAGLGPVRLLSAACDILCDEAAEFERQARAAGGDVRRTVLPRLPHDFLLFAGRVPEAADALSFVGRELAGWPPAVPISGPSEERS